MNCVTCGREIPEARLRAKPDAKQCVPCVEAAGDEPAVRGRMIWSSKHAPEIEIGTALATQSDANRRGYGPTIRFQPIEGAFGAARQVAAARELSELADLIREVDKEEK